MLYKTYKYDLYCIVFLAILLLEVLQHLHASQHVWDTLNVLIEFLVESRVGSCLDVIQIPGEGVMRGS